MSYSPEQKTKMLGIFKIASDYIGEVKDPNNKKLIEELLKKDLANETPEQLAAWLQAPAFVSGLASTDRNKDVLKNLYSQAGLAAPTAPGAAPDMAALTARMTKATLTGDEAEMKAIAEEMLAAAQTSGPNGGLNTPMIVGAVGLISKFLLGASIPEAAKYSAIAALASTAWNWYNTPAGQAAVGSLTGGLGKGADSLLAGLTGGAGGLFGMLGGGAEGLGGAFTSLTDNPKLKGMLGGLMNLVTEQPILAAAIGYGLYNMFGNGLSLGGIFSGMPTLLLAVAVAMVAQNYLGMDPGTHARPVFAEHSPTSLPSISGKGGVQVL